MDHSPTPLVVIIVQEQTLTYTLNFGPINIGWRLQGPDSAWRFFRDAYQTHRTDGSVDLHVEASIVDPPTGSLAPDLPNSFMRARSVRGNDFILGDNLITGTLVSDTECRCEIHPVLLEGCGLRVLEQFFYLLFQHTIRLRFSERRRTPFLLHCCAVRDSRGGVLFCGPSGTGKSTIASLFPAGTVLTDECAIITPGRESYLISGSPVNPTFTAKITGSAPLSRIYLISHGEINKLADISGLEAIPRLAAEVMVPIGLLEMDIELAMSRALDMAIGLAGATTVKDLEFLPNQDICKLITDDRD